MKSLPVKYTVRILLSLVASIFFGFLISEGSFILLNKNEPAENQDFVLIIPQGTAARVAKGLSVPTIPENLVFYEGDRIIVKNEDIVSHQLGPIWVPAGASGILDLGTQREFTVNCSFQPSQKLGLDVRPKTNSSIRIQGILAISLPSSVLLFLFSIVLAPISNVKPGEEKNDD